MGEEANARRNLSTGTLRFVPTHQGKPQGISVTIKQKGQTVFSKRLSVAQNRDLYMIPGVYENQSNSIKIES